MNRRTRTNDILSVGELLIDFISSDYADSLDQVKSFECLQGGSPANFCMNMARLGNVSKLVASVGNDDMGTFLKNAVARVGVDVEGIAQVASPTSLILVTKTQTVAHFEAYRAADCQISAAQLPSSMLKNCSVYHTTCFALSKNPAQKNGMNAAKRAAQAGCQLSLDANYAQKIWEDRAQAQRLVAEYCSYGALVKVSEVDWERLYESPLTDPEKAARHFISLGAKAVCVTLGGEGCFVASASEKHFLPARKVEVKDTTGAGDAFWSGFLTGWLDGHSLLDCAKAGRRMAEIKLGHFGTLPVSIERGLIYVDL